jgi:hypothetical protein
VTRLSPELEKRLLAASEYAAQLADRGDHPSTAVEKAAREHRIPPGGVELLVNAYNTGRTRLQFDLGDSPLEKAAEFELADAKTVNQRLYPDTVKTAGQTHLDTVVARDYAIPPRADVCRRAQQPRLKVAATAAELAKMLSGFTVDQPRGSYRRFRDPSDAVLKDYPIEGVTYPTDYGYLPGYVGEDDDDLDVFKGSGGKHGVMRVNRPDVKGGSETKLLYGMTPEEMSAVISAFGPVVNSRRELAEAELVDLLSSFKRQDSAGKTVKMAAEEPVRDPELVIRETRARVHGYKQDWQKAAAEAELAISTFVNRVQALAHYLNSGDALPLPGIRKTAELVFGPTANSILDQAVALRPGLEKLPRHKRAGQLLDIPYDAEPLRLIQAVMDAAPAVPATKQAAAEAQAVFEKAREESRPAAAFFPSILEGDRVKSGFVNLISNPLQALGAFTLAEKSINTVAGGLKPPEKSEILQKNLEELTDPEHENQLRAIRTRGLLQDLITNDPVISSYDPEDVTGAFNELAQVAPTGTDQRAIMTSLLRKRLQQGQLDTFDIDQLMGMERKIQQQRSPQAMVALQQ